MMTGAFHQAEAAVVFSLQTHVALGRDRLVIILVENLDDRATNFDGEGNEKGAAERFDNAFADRGLAVSGRAIKENGSAGIDRRTDLIKDLVVKDQSTESVAQALGVDRNMAKALLGDNLDVGLDRDGRGPQRKWTARNIARPGRGRHR